MPDTVVSVRRASSGKVSSALSIILVVYFVGRILEVLPLSTPSTPIVALEILSALAFAIVHGAQHYGLRGILAFAGICLVIGNALENLSVLTGFPFGHYEFLSLMGPKLFHVPILLGIAYIGMAYVSWTLACLIAGSTGGLAKRSQLLTIPLLAGLIMTAWDLAQDPVWSTLLHAWRWRDGGLWFGVPLTNFAGWLLTVSLIYFAFALYLCGIFNRRTELAQPHWRAGVGFYAFCALGNILQMLRPQRAAVVADPTGTLWQSATILRASAFVSVFGMGIFVLLAWFRAGRSHTTATD